MSNKVDKLFKDKLEGDSLPPSAHAWEKVEAHLGKKNKMVLWARVAAAVAVMGLLTFAVLNWNKGYEKPKQEIVKENIRKQEPEQAPVVEKKEAPKESKQVRKHKVQPKVVVTPIAEESVEEVALVPEPVIIEAPKKEKGITLTYSLPAIKKQEVAPAPAEPLVAEQNAEQKKSGFERVMEIAKEVKNGDALGELRQAKDDIFALDFRKDKNKKQ